MDDISNNLLEQQLLRESPLEQLQYQRETESKDSAKQKLAKDVQKDDKRQRRQFYLGHHLEKPVRWPDG